MLGGEDVARPCDPWRRAHGERLDIPSTVHRRKGGERGRRLADGRAARERDRRSARRRRGRRDVGEPQRTDARRRESEAKYRALTEQLPTITYLHPLGERGESALRQPAGRRPCSATRPRSGSQSPNLFFQLVHAEDRERVTRPRSPRRPPRTAAAVRVPDALARRAGRLGSGRGRHGARRRRPAALRPGLPPGRQRAQAGRRGAGAAAGRRARGRRARRRPAAQARRPRARERDPRLVAPTTRPLFAGLPSWPCASWPTGASSTCWTRKATRRELAAAHAGPGMPPGPEPGPEPEPEILEVARTAAPSSRSRACASRCGPAAARSAR